MNRIIPKDYETRIVVPGIRGLVQQMMFDGRNFHPVPDEPLGFEEEPFFEEENEGEEVDQIAGKVQEEARQRITINREEGNIVSAGVNHTLVLKNGIMYGCGNNSSRQLLDSEEERFLNFVKLPRGEILHDERIVSVRAGDHFSLALTETGEVFFWGRNIGGVSLQETLQIHHPKHIAGSIGINIARIECGSSHIVFLTTSGDVYTCGMDTNGALGNNHDQGFESYLGRRLNLQPITEIRSKGNQSAALDVNGNVYLWGEGILGIEQKETEGRVSGIALGTQKLFMTVVMPDQSLVLNIYDIQNDITTLIEIAENLYISAGNNFFVFLSLVNDVVTLKANGENLHGKLGIGEGDDFVTEENEFVEIPIPDDAPNVVNISCGDNHSVAIDEDGKVFTWGNNYDGELGTWDRESRNVPTRIYSRRN